MIFWERLCLKLKKTILSMWFISLEREVGAHKTSFSETLFYLSACTKQGKWAVMFVSDIEFASYYHCSIVFSNNVVFFPYHYIFYLHNHQKYFFFFSFYSFSWISIYNFWLPLFVFSSFFYAIMYHGLMPVFWRFQSRNQKTSRWRTHSITTKAHEHKQQWTNNCTEN